MVACRKRGNLASIKNHSSLSQHSPFPHHAAQCSPARPACFVHARWRSGRQAGRPPPPCACTTPARIAERSRLWDIDSTAADTDVRTSRLRQRSNGPSPLPTAGEDLFVLVTTPSSKGLRLPQCPRRIAVSPAISLSAWHIKLARLQSENQDIPANSPLLATHNLVVR